MKEVLKDIISKFHARGMPELVNRSIDIPLHSNKVISVIGPRRAGKTYMLFQAMKGISDITDIVYVNFEDDRLSMSAADLDMILQAYFELYPEKEESRLYFFFDEIQEVSGWEKFVRRVYDTISKKVFVTGSSAKLLSREIATSLRGRTIPYYVLPLSFEEYLAFKEYDIDLNTTKGKAALIKEFLEFMVKGGFPETVFLESEMHLKVLRQYFDVMLYKDIIERYSLGNSLALKKLVRKVISNSSKSFSVFKTFNELKSEGIKLSKDSIYKYIDYCEDAFMFFTLSNYSRSVSKQRVRKIYSVDTGLSSNLSFSLSKDSGRLFENVVFLQLKRLDREVFVYQGKGECDFVIMDREKVDFVIQVCFKLTKQNREREINGLLEAMEEFKLDSGLIVTLDQYEDIELSGKLVKVRPIYSWLLGNE